jgi:hypothetical protein
MVHLAEDTKRIKATQHICFTSFSSVWSKRNIEEASIIGNEKNKCFIQAQTFLTTNGLFQAVLGLSIVRS